MTDDPIAREILSHLLEVFPRDVERSAIVGAFPAEGPDAVDAALNELVKARLIVIRFGVVTARECRGVLIGEHQAIVAMLMDR